MLINILMNLPIVGFTYLLGLLPGLSVVPTEILNVFATIVGTLKAFDWIIPYNPIALSIIFVTTWWTVELTIRFFRLTIGAIMRRATK